VPVSVTSSGSAFVGCVEGAEARVIAAAGLAALQAFGAGKPILVLAAAGKSSPCLASAWSAAGKPFPLVSLSFLPQEGWDEILLTSDFSIVRGEDSWARAALSGRPFLWQAYPQEGRGHMVKVAAFLDRLRPYFAPESSAALSALEELYLSFNDRERDGPEETGLESLLPVLSRRSELLPAFTAFSDSLAGRTDLASGLVTFLREIV